MKLADLRALLAIGDEEAQRIELTLQHRSDASKNPFIAEAFRELIYLSLTDSQVADALYGLAWAMQISERYPPRKH